MKMNLLLSLGLVLVSVLHAHHTEHKKHITDINELSGKWHSIYLASNEKSRIETGGDMSFSIDNIEVRDRDMIFNLFCWKDEKCTLYPFVVNKTEENNVFKIDYEGENTVYLESFKANEYALFCTHNIQDGKETVVIELYGRTTHVSEKIKKAFNKLCKKHGIEKDGIIDMIKYNKCQ